MAPVAGSKSETVCWYDDGRDLLILPLWGGQAGRIILAAGDHARHALSSRQPCHSIACCYQIAPHVSHGCNCPVCVCCLGRGVCFCVCVGGCVYGVSVVCGASTGQEYIQECVVRAETIWRLASSRPRPTLVLCRFDCIMSCPLQVCGLPSSQMSHDTLSLQFSCLACHVSCATHRPTL